MSTILFIPTLILLALSALRTRKTGQSRLDGNTIADFDTTARQRFKARRELADNASILMPEDHGSLQRCTTDGAFEIGRQVRAADARDDDLYERVAGRYDACFRHIVRAGTAAENGSVLDA